MQTASATCIPYLFKNCTQQTNLSRVFLENELIFTAYTISILYLKEIYSFKIAYNLQCILQLDLYWSSPRPISISQLNMLPYLHL